MKHVSLAVLSVLALGLSACEQQSPPTQEQRIQKAVTENVHPLTSDERSRAETNAKKYFEKSWIIANGEHGQLNDCRPSDSNSNGMVTCHGFVPKAGGGYSENKIYCGYRLELVGCSDEDTVVIK